jgi:hypothetical protein
MARRARPASASGESHPAPHLHQVHDAAVAGLLQGELGTGKQGNVRQDLLHRALPSSPPTEHPPPTDRATWNTQALHTDHISQQQTALRHRAQCPMVQGRGVDGRHDDSNRSPRPTSDPTIFCTWDSTLAVATSVSFSRRRKSAATVAISPRFATVDARALQQRSTRTRPQAQGRGGTPRALRHG